MKARGIDSIDESFCLRVYFLSDFIGVMRVNPHNCASSAAVTDYVWMLSVTLLRVWQVSSVRLFSIKKDNAYYAPLTDMSRNMHSIHTTRRHARKHVRYA